MATKQHLVQKASVKNLNLYKITLDILNINYRKEYNTSLKTVLDVLLPTDRVDQMSAVIQ
jgi:hypothetical protein